jgi:hypothetical protein
MKRTELTDLVLRTAVTTVTGYAVNKFVGYATGRLYDYMLQYRKVYK